MINATRIVALVKQHGWVVNLAFIAFGSYFVAGAAIGVVARSFRGVPPFYFPPGGAGTGRRPTAQRSHVDYAAMANRNLFGARREILDPASQIIEDSEDTELGDVNDADLKPCSMPASLRATLVADGAPEWSMAVIYINADREPRVFNINDGTNQITADALLIEVRSREIVVRRTDHYELCKAEGEGTTKASPPRASRSKESKGSGDSSGSVTKTGDGEYDVDKSLVDSALSNLSEVATKARIVPSFKNGKPNGFKLFSIKPGSIFAKIGLQNGDVIQKINGYEMNSPDKALELYQKLKDSTNVSIDLQRRGRAKSFSYSIR